MFGIVLSPQDIARYINATKGDYEGMRQIEEVEQSLEQYRGPHLTTYGNYHLDGELRIKSADGGNARTWVCVHVPIECDLYVSSDVYAKYLLYVTLIIRNLEYFLASYNFVYSLALVL